MGNVTCVAEVGAAAAHGGNIAAELVRQVLALAAVERHGADAATQPAHVPLRFSFQSLLCVMILI